MRFKTLGWLVGSAALLVALVDGGSVLLTEIQVPDQVRAAGRVAAVTAADKPVDRPTALAAFEAARDDARTYGIRISRRTFTLQPDGQVRLTGIKVAPTLVAGRIPALRPLTVARSTVTVEEPTFR